MQLNVIPRLKVRKQQDRRGKRASHGEQGIHVPSTFPKAGPGQSNNANDNVRYVHGGESEVDEVSSAGPGERLRVVFETKEEEMEYEDASDRSLVPSSLRYCSAIAPLFPTLAFPFRVGSFAGCHLSQ